MLNSRQTKTLLLVLVFLVCASFLFLSVPRIVSAQGGEVQVPFGGGPNATAIAQTSDAAQNSISNIFSPVVFLLTIVLGLVRILLQASGTLFAWIVAPGNQTALMGQPVIYQTWMMVRDLLNVAFILVLLFSAFSTIFQVEKYSYKKLLLNLVLMALLVNFSFPIARVIIDASNILMYSLINRMTISTPAVPNGTAKQAMGAIAFGAEYAKMLNVQNTDVSFLLSAIIFGFILAITLLAIAVMFVIRMVALAILIIFSPVAFVAAILPGTASYSNQWWHNLFKYAFFGPIMIFVLYISSSLIVQLGSTASIRHQFELEAVNHTDSASNAGIIGVIASYSLPIVILWFGMGMASSMGGAAAGAVMGTAQKVSKGAGKKFSGYNAFGRQYSSFKAKRDERLKEKSKGGPGAWLGDKANDISDTARGVLPFGGKATKRMEKRHKDKNKDDIDKGAKDLIDGGANTDTLANEINQDFKSPSADKVETAKRASAYLRQDSDERKMHIQSTLERAGGIEGSDLEHIINESGKGLEGAALEKHLQDQISVRGAAGNVATARKKGAKIDENDIRIIAGFMNKQMRRKVEVGANATASPSKTVSYLKSKFSRTEPKPPAQPVRLAETPEERRMREERKDQEGNRQENNRSELGK